MPTYQTPTGSVTVPAGTSVNVDSQGRVNIQTPSYQASQRSSGGSHGSSGSSQQQAQSQLPPQMVYVPELNRYVDYSQNQIVKDASGNVTIVPRSQPMQTSGGIASPTRNVTYSSYENYQRGEAGRTLPSEVAMRTPEGASRLGLAYGFEQALAREQTRRQEQPMLLPASQMTRGSEWAGVPYASNVTRAEIETPIYTGKQEGLLGSWWSKIETKAVLPITKPIYRETGEMTTPLLRPMTPSEFSKITLEYWGFSYLAPKVVSWTAKTLFPSLPEKIDIMWKNIGFKVQKTPEYYVPTGKEYKLESPLESSKRATLGYTEKGGMSKQTIYIPFKGYAQTKGAVTTRTTEIFNLDKYPDMKFVKTGITAQKSQVIFQEYTFNKGLGINYLGRSTYKTLPTEFFFSKEAIPVLATKQTPSMTWSTGKGEGFYIGLTNKNYGIIKETYVSAQAKKTFYDDFLGVGFKKGEGFTQMDSTVIFGGKAGASSKVYDTIFFKPLKVSQPSYEFFSGTGGGTGRGTTTGVSAKTMSTIIPKIASPIPLKTMTESMSVPKIAVQFAVPRTALRTELMTGIIPKLANRTEPKLSLLQIPRIDPKLESVTISTLKPFQVTIPKISTTPKITPIVTPNIIPEILPLITIPIISPPPITPFPTGLYNLSLPKFFEFTVPSSRRKTKYKSGKSFIPSPVALYEGIKKKTRTEGWWSGLEIRPIPIYNKKIKIGW